jgi:hypothetical protein
MIASRTILVSLVFLLVAPNAHSFAFSSPRQGRLLRSRGGFLQGASPSDELPSGQRAGPSPELRRQIEEEITRNAPSELEMRLEVLGVTVWTKAGFALAFGILALNVVLGGGWASDLFGLSDDFSTAPAPIVLFDDLRLDTKVQAGNDLDPALQQRIERIRDAVAR